MTSLVLHLRKSIMQGHVISREESLQLYHEDLHTLLTSANDLREYFCQNRFDLCSIINGKSGRCTEDCKFCAQSSAHSADVEIYPLLDDSTIHQEGIYNRRKGVLRYSVVTSGRSLNDSEVDALCETYRSLHKSSDISLCASHGLLSYDQFVRLKDSGVSRYHNNLETSRRYFPTICTTHTYEEKIRAIRDAQRAGLTVCSGGILGLGETVQDRIDMALELRNLGVKSIPVNVFHPIPNTPFESKPIISYEEVLRTIAVFRFIHPDSAIRLAGGRGLLPDKGECAFISGANAAITGNMLTTSGITIDDDISMIHRLKYEIGLLP